MMKRALPVLAIVAAPTCVGLGMVSCGGAEEPGTDPLGGTPVDGSKNDGSSGGSGTGGSSGRAGTSGSSSGSGAVGDGSTDGPVVPQRIATKEGLPTRSAGCGNPNAP